MHRRREDIRPTLVTTSNKNTNTSLHCLSMASNRVSDYIPFAFCISDWAPMDQQRTLSSLAHVKSNPVCVIKDFVKLFFCWYSMCIVVSCYELRGVIQVRTLTEKQSWVFVVAESHFGSIVPCVVIQGMLTSLANTWYHLCFSLLHSHYVHCCFAF